MTNKDDTFDRDYYDNSSMILLRFPFHEGEDVFDALLDVTECEVELVGFFRFDRGRLVQIN